jgi:hypothetical protein
MNMKDVTIELVRRQRYREIEHSLCEAETS